MTEFSRLLDELHLEGNGDETLPPITALLSKLQQRLIGGPPDPSLLVDTVAGFFRTADPHRLFDSADGEAALEAAYVSAVCALIGRAALPAYERARDGPPTPDRYARVPDVAARVCAALQGLLGKVEAAGPDRRARGVLVAVAPHVCVYAITHTQEQPWTSRASREAARRLRASLLGAGSWRDCAHMLTGERAGADGAKVGAGGILEAVLDVLRPRLTKEAWQRGDEVESAFAWTLFQLALRCLLDLLPVLESPPSSVPAGPSPAPRRARRHDDVLRLILTHMEAEHEVALRRVYARALPAYLERMGVSACRHLRRLGRVVPAYLEVSDAPEEVTRIFALQALECILTAAWPRLAHSVSVWLPCLLRLLADAPSELDTRRDVARRLSGGAARCAALLAAAAGGRLRVSARVARRTPVKLHVRQCRVVCVRVTVHKTLCCVCLVFNSTTAICTRVKCYTTGECLTVHNTVFVCKCI
ncbi:TELO2-interacting protein 2 isoform X3 [Phyllopteryx taeniolatus]|uniref:TELO2-interacting protein 2 isoform X3 n=1 Tax=Phyllopteryx taeniolatus TaxID=161469 RepID=UPI002AD54639|nr:TELO2-interacting protein 2 isoform X3 [Phyllopteryx taeniolatus]